MVDFLMEILKVDTFLRLGLIQFNRLITQFTH